MNEDLNDVLPRDDVLPERCVTPIACFIFDTVSSSLSVISFSSFQSYPLLKVLWRSGVIL